MNYGPVEYRYAAPIAKALAEDGEFRRWVLSRSKFADSTDARILHEEIRGHRKNPTAEWWRFHFTPTCDCLGCDGGKETDIFTVFDDGSKRFAIHFEVKQPKDKFKADGVQARGYPLRAECWIAKTPRTVLPHSEATTGIFFSEAKRDEYAPYLGYFPVQITFEEIEKKFPYLASWLAPAELDASGETVGSNNVMASFPDYSVDSKAELPMQGGSEPVDSTAQFWEDLRTFQKLVHRDVPIFIEGRKGSVTDVWPKFYLNQLAGDSKNPRRKRFEIGFTGNQVALYTKKVAYAEFKSAIEPLLENGMRVAPAAKSWQSVRIMVPQVDSRRPVEDQTDNLDSVFIAAKRLYQFFLQNEAALLGVKTAKVI